MARFLIHGSDKHPGMNLQYSIAPNKPRSLIGKYPGSIAQSWPNMGLLIYIKKMHKQISGSEHQTLQYTCVFGGI